MTPHWARLQLSDYVFEGRRDPTDKLLHFCDQCWTWGQFAPAPSWGFQSQVSAPHLDFHRGPHHQKQRLIGHCLHRGRKKKGAAFIEGSHGEGALQKGGFLQAPLGPLGGLVDHRSHRWPPDFLEYSGSSPGKVSKACEFAWSEIRLSPSPRVWLLLGLRLDLFIFRPLSTL